MSSVRGRRRFLRRVLWRGLDEIEKVGRALVRPVATADPTQEGMGGAPPDLKRFLRPPGAMAEADFAEACSRCGDCVRSCPAQCIELDASVAGGLPHVVARVSPCVICEDLSCMKACPTGALSLVREVGQIRMGLAVVDHHRCLRHRDPPVLDNPNPSDADSGCRLCIDDCPLGEVAIGLDAAGNQVEVRSGCVGCGVCERVCPTEPASVTVVPADGDAS